MHGFSKDALEIIQSYLSDSFQCIKINTTIISWTELIQEVPRRSVLEPILFNGLFFLLNHLPIYNFTDDTTAYICDANLESVLKKLEENSELAITWFEKNYMKLNTNKYRG